VRIQNLRDHVAPFNYYQGEVDPKFEIANGDLLFAWSGTPNTSFGAHIWERGRAVLNQHIFKIETYQNVTRDYLYYALNALVELFITRAKGGGGLAHISKGDFLSTLVALPPIGEQPLIARRLADAVESQVRQLQLINDSVNRIDEMRMSMLRRAITGRLKTNDDNDTRVELLPSSAKKRLAAKRLPNLSSSGASQTVLPLLEEELPLKTTRLKRALPDVLDDLGPTNAQRLMEEAGYRTDSQDEVNEFYDRLKSGLRRGLIEALYDEVSNCHLLKAGHR
jgi:hypothetical protein